jgi:ferredoxin
MADLSSRLPSNGRGALYSYSTCIGCGLCSSTAPDIFTLDDNGQALVVHQPETAEEIELATQALDDCPVQSIGNDGE